MKACARMFTALAAKNGSVLSKCRRTRRERRMGSTVTEPRKAPTVALSLEAAGSISTGAGPRIRRVKKSCSSAPSCGFSGLVDGFAGSAGAPAEAALRSPMSSTARSASVRLLSSS